METLLEENGYPLYLIDCEDNKEFDLTFFVYQVNEWDMKNKPIKYDKYLSGHIRWDGICHFYFGDAEGYIYFLVKNFIEDHKKVIDALWNKAEKEIVNFDKKCAY